jgi:xanthine/uracil permease
MEGPAGLWWGVILSLAASTQALGQSVQVLGGNLEVGILLSGGLIVVLGLLGMGWTLRRLFTPIVTSTFYFLLAAQLCLIFFKGMIGLANGSTIQPAIALLSLVLAALVLILSIWGRGLLSNFALLIGIILGWIAFRLLFPGQLPASTPADMTTLFALFPLGNLAVNAGLIATIILVGLISLSNTYASLEGVETQFGMPVSTAQYKRSFVITGLSSIVSGLFGLVPYAPYTSSLGFLRATRLLSRAPFLIGAGLFILLGVVPILGQLFATLPVSVGDAVLFIAYLQLFGAALSTLDGITFSFKTINRLAAPVLLGLSLLALPATVFGTVPAIVRPLLQNGLVMGILLAMIMEHVVRWEKVK